MMNKIILLTISILIVSCGSNAIGPKYDLKSYETENIGDGVQLVAYYDANGYPLAKGEVVNGVRNGTWVTFHPGSNKIKTLTTYIHGIRTGAEISMNDRGQIETFNEFKKDVLHGISAKYQFGRPIEETTYKNGKLNGPFSIYNSKMQLQRKGFFKNGKQDGLLQYFDEKGNVTLEYQYKNGEKISGGIVEKKAEDNEAKQ